MVPGDSKLWGDQKMREEGKYTCGGGEEKVVGVVEEEELEEKEEEEGEE